jgi:hypothetical protein
MRSPVTNSGGVKSQRGGEPPRRDDGGGSEPQSGNAREPSAFVDPSPCQPHGRRPLRRNRLRVHVSHESMPPWNPDHDWRDYHAYFVVMDVDAAAIRAVADEWVDEIRVFPTGRASPRTCWRSEPVPSARRWRRHIATGSSSVAAGWWPDYARPGVPGVDVVRGAAGGMERGRRCHPW